MDKVLPKERSQNLTRRQNYCAKKKARRRKRFRRSRVKKETTRYKRNDDDFDDDEIRRMHSNRTMISFSFSRFLSFFFFSLSLSASARARRGGYKTATNSTSNCNVAFPGITPPAPLAPYPNSGGMMSTLFPPTFMPSMPSAPRMPSSHPCITCRTPTLNLSGEPRSYELSNTRPFVNRPV